MGEKPAWGVWRGIGQLSAASRSKSARPALRRIGGLPAEGRVNRPVGFQTKEDIRFTGKMPELILTASDAPRQDPEKLFEYFAARTVLVSNLGPTINDVELREAGKAAGPVRAVRVFSHFWTGCSTGCAAVEFTRDSAAGAAVADPAPIFQELRGSKNGKIVLANINIIRRLYHVRPNGSFDPDRNHWSFGTWLSPETIQRLCAAAREEEYFPIEPSKIHFTPSAALAAVAAALEALGTDEVPQQLQTLAMKSEKLDLLDLPNWPPLHPLQLESQAPPSKARRVEQQPGRVLGQLSRWTQLAAQQQQQHKN